MTEDSNLIIEFNHTSIQINTIVYIKNTQFTEKQ